MEKELTAEFGKTEERQDLAAVEYKRSRPWHESLAPLREDLAISGKQRHPPGDRRRTVSRPVIHGRQPRVQAAGVAKKSEIRGEVELVEIGGRVGQSIRRDAH